MIVVLAHNTRLQLYNRSNETCHFGMDAEIQAMDGNSPQAQNPKNQPH